MGGNCINPNNGDGAWGPGVGIPGGEKGSDLGSVLVVKMSEFLEGLHIKCWRLRSERLQDFHLDNWKVIDTIFWESCRKNRFGWATQNYMCK